MRYLWWYLHDFSSALISIYNQSGAVMHRDERNNYTIRINSHR